MAISISAEPISSKDLASEPASTKATALTVSVMLRINSKFAFHIASPDLCIECHGDDGSVETIEGVEGLEGVEITPINTRDVLYTLTDSAMVEVISYGRPNYGMNPFGLAYGGELTRTQIDHMVTFMRYAWDDRFEMPEIPELFPPLAEGEVPSYEVHISPIVKRYCVSCHRAGKDNNDFLMTSYDEILTTGERPPSNTPDAAGADTMGGSQKKCGLPPP